MKPPVITCMENWNGDFVGDLSYYLTKGVVYASDRAFICMRPIRHTEGTKSCPDLDKADCWLVWWAAGDMKEMFRIAPKELKYIAFFRLGRQGLRIYRFDKLKEKIWQQK